MEISLMKYHDLGLKNSEKSVLVYIDQSIKIFCRGFVLIPAMSKEINGRKKSCHVQTDDLS